MEFKKNKVKGNLERIGGFEQVEIEKVIGMENPWRYRNKAQFPVGKNKDGEIITGFYAGRTHSIIPNRNCYLGAEVNEEILNQVLAYMTDNHVEPYEETSGKGLVRHIQKWIQTRGNHGVHHCQWQNFAKGEESHRTASDNTGNDKHQPECKYKTKQCHSWR